MILKCHRRMMFQYRPKSISYWSCYPYFQMYLKMLNRFWFALEFFETNICLWLIVFALDFVMFGKSTSVCLFVVRTKFDILKITWLKNGFLNYNGKWIRLIHMVNIQNRTCERRNLLKVNIGIHSKNCPYFDIYIFDYSATHIATKYCSDI